MDETESLRSVLPLTATSGFGPIAELRLHGRSEQKEHQRELRLSSPVQICCCSTKNQNSTNSGRPSSGVVQYLEEPDQRRSERLDVGDGHAGRSLEHRRQQLIAATHNLRQRRETSFVRSAAATGTQQEPNLLQVCSPETFPGNKNAKINARSI